MIRAEKSVSQNQYLGRGRLIIAKNAQTSMSIIDICAAQFTPFQ